MNERQRLIETLTFGVPDRVPFTPGGPRESTLERWRGEGLGPDRDYRRALMDAIGIVEKTPSEREAHGVSFLMMPAFEEKVLEHRGGHYIVRDWMGAVTEISDRYDLTYLRSPKDFVTRKWHRFPVENRADWARMKTRYDPAAPGRFPDDFEARCHRLAARDYPLAVAFHGPFWQLREWCGFENLCLLTVEDPGFVLEMADFWRDFVLVVLERLLARLVPDLVLINEDMAYKGKSMISPAMVRRFLVPSWRAWTGRVRRAGCPIVEIDSDGFVGELIPLWIEAGISACSPMEIAAGNDLPAYRRRFNRDIAFRGGIDKRAIARGGETMARAVRETVLPLLAGGGYIPSCDHGVPPDVSWPDFVAYARLLARLTGWLPVGCRGNG